MQRLILYIVALIALGCPDMKSERLEDVAQAYKWNWTDTVTGKMMSEFRPLRLTNKMIKYGNSKATVDSLPGLDADTTAHDSGCNGGYSFALKTNLLYDAALIPNIGVEFPIGRHFTVGADWMYAWWGSHDRNRHWRIYGGDINARWYFGRRGSRHMTGHHVGLYGQVLVFQVAFGGKGYITGIPGENLWGKPYLGGGVEYGYSMRIGKRLNLDLSLGLGYMNGEYRVYRPDQGHYLWQSSHRRDWIGPTKAEVTLELIIGKMPGKGGGR